MPFDHDYEVEIGGPTKADDHDVLMDNGNYLFKRVLDIAPESDTDLIGDTVGHNHEGSGEGVILQTGAITDLNITYAKLANSVKWQGVADVITAGEVNNTIKYINLDTTSDFRDEVIKVVFQADPTEASVVDLDSEDRFLTISTTPVELYNVGATGNNLTVSILANAGDGKLRLKLDTTLGAGFDWVGAIQCYWQGPFAAADEFTLLGS